MYICSSAEPFNLLQRAKRNAEGQLLVPKLGSVAMNVWHLEQHDWNYAAAFSVSQKNFHRIRTGTNHRASLVVLHGWAKRAVGAVCKR